MEKKETKNPTEANNQSKLESVLAKAMVAFREAKECSQTITTGNNVAESLKVIHNTECVLKDTLVLCKRMRESLSENE